MWPIIKYTFREALTKKLILIFFSFTTLVLLIFTLIFVFSSEQSLVTQGDTMSTLREEVNRQFVKFLQLMIVSPLFSGTLFISIFTASGFISSMVEKGNIDLLLSKPISRTNLLLSKIIGVTLIIFLNIAYAVVGFWFLIGIKFGIWNFSFLVPIFIILLAFIVFFSLITLISVTLKNSILAIILSYLIFLIFSPAINFFNSVYIVQYNSDEFVKIIVKIFYYIIPPIAELGNMVAKIAIQENVDSIYPVFACIVWSLTIFICSFIIFKRKDY